MKRLVSEFHALEINTLANEGLLWPSSKFERVLDQSQYLEQTTVAITVLTDALQLVFPMGAASVRQDIRLTYSSGPRGGKRPWFACPTCQQRVGILYHAPNLPFRCRLCCNLAYPSQYQSRNQSYGRHHRWSGIGAGAGT